MGEIQTYASNTNDINILFIIITLWTYNLYEIDKAILDNDDMVGGMMIQIEQGSQV